MKQMTDYNFSDEIRSEAETYISYKRSLGFSVSVEEQRKLAYMLKFIYVHNNGNISHLTEDTVCAFLSKSESCKPRTKHANQSLIRQYGLYLKLNGDDSYIYPSTLIQCPKDFTPYIFTEEEITLILNQADKIGPNKNKFVNTPLIYPAVFRILYACGTRVGETLALKTTDVDLEEGILTLHNGKNKVSRMIPMSDSLTKYLRRYAQKVDRSDGNPYFFPALHGECYSQTTILNTFKKLMKSAGIKPMSNGKYPRVHDLRHTYAVHALEASISKGMDPYCSLPALSTYMGHKGIESTEYYLRLTKQYFISVLNYTQEQANIIFPEV